MSNTPPYIGTTKGGYVPPDYNKVFHVTNGCLSIHSDRIAEGIEYMQRNKIDMITITRHHGYNAKDIDFILDIPWLKGVYFGAGINPSTDISAIEKCTWLERLAVGAAEQPLDLSHLTSLRELRFRRKNKNILLLPTADNGKNIEIIAIGHPRDKTLEFLPPYKNLQRLEIYHGSIVSLSGLERFKNLKIYEHYYGKNLVDVNAVTELPNLEDITFDHCKKIQWEGVFERCKALRILGLQACSDIPSLSFLKQIKNLTGFGFSDCTILDGDLTPLLELEHFGFYPNKRHHSHTLEELEKLHAQKQRK